MNLLPRIFPAAIACTMACTAAGAFAESSPTLERIAQTGTITLGHRESSIPFSYLNGTQPVGFAMDLCMRVVDALKVQTKRPDLKVNYQMVTSSNRLPLVQNGTVDLECGSTTNNTVRQKEVAFTLNHFYTGTRLLTRKDSGITKLADLKGKTLATTAGTTNLQVLRRLIHDSNLEVNMLSAKDHADAVLLVESGRAVAFGMDDILLYGFAAAATKPADWAVVGEPIQVEPYAIMLRRDDPEFKKVVDAAMLKTIQSGEFEVLYRKWFQSPIPPKNVNLNVPISEDLKRHLKAPSDRPNL